VLIDVLDHQVDIQRDTGVFSQGFTKPRAQGEVGHIVSVHNIDMEIVDLLLCEDVQGSTQVEEIGTHHRR